jgi:hypothetical protein
VKLAMHLRLTLSRISGAIFPHPPRPKKDDIVFYHSKLYNLLTIWSGSWVVVQL